MRARFMKTWMSIAIASLVCAGVAHADFQMKPVSWRVASDTSRVDGFRVYAGPSPNPTTLEFEGPVIADNQGVYTVDVPAQLGAVTFVRITAYNAAGESPPSEADRHDLPAPTSEPLGQPGQPQPEPGL